MKLLDTPFDPLNSFMAPCLLIRLPNLLDYYQFSSKKSENLKIRHCLINQATAILKLGSWLIYQAAA